MEMDHTLEQEEIKKGFETLGISQDQRGEYHGAENFGSGFKRCSILKDVPTYYSRSTHLEK